VYIELGVLPVERGTPNFILFNSLFLAARFEHLTPNANHKNSPDGILGHFPFATAGFG
jgi:hypothetical protein